MSETELPGPWQRIFYDGTDAAGRRQGWIEDRRLIAAVPCIGCRLRERDPEKAMSRTYEVWVNGERQEDEREGCWCDLIAETGGTPWRLGPPGSLSAAERCRVCGGRGMRDSRRAPGRTFPCSACNGTGWAAGKPPGGEET